MFKDTVKNPYEDEACDRYTHLPSDTYLYVIEAARDCFNEAVEACQKEHDREMRELFEEIEKAGQDIDENGKGTDNPDDVVETIYWIGKGRLQLLKERFGGK